MLTITILTLVISGVTTFIAYRTLQSQKNTEHLQNQSVQILSDIKQTEATFRNDVSRFSQAIDQREAMLRQARAEIAMTRIKDLAFGKAWLMAKSLASWFPDLLDLSPTDISQALYQRHRDLDIIRQQYDLDVITLTEVEAYHVEAGCLKINQALINIKSAIVARDSDSANAAAKLLKEVQADWETWTIMDHPKATNAHEWIQQCRESRPSTSCDIPLLSTIPGVNALVQSVRSSQLTNGQWFVWFPGGITWDQWKASQHVEGYPIDETSKLFFPFPIFWSLGPSKNSEHREIEKAIMLWIHRITRSNDNKTP